MRRTQDTLRVLSFICASFFAWAIAAEIDLFPRLGESAWFRWQVMVLSGLVFWVTADSLAELRCRCCGAHEVQVRGLLTHSHELLCKRCLQWDPSLDRWNPALDTFTPSTPLR